TYLVNGTGAFTIGGPMGDAGLTGRKIIVDTYGGYARHGGGAFSGKDPTKVDRSAAYALRYVAKNVVKAGLADRFEVQIAYVIGGARPISLNVETFGTGKVSDELIRKLIEEHFDFRPQAIIDRFALRRPAIGTLLANVRVGTNDLAPAVPVALGLFLAYLIGGYVAGRMAGYRTSWHGMMTAFFSLFVVLVLMLAGYAADRGLLAVTGVESVTDVIPGVRDL